MTDEVARGVSEAAWTRAGEPGSSSVTVAGPSRAVLVAVDTWASRGAEEVEVGAEEGPGLAWSSEAEAEAEADAEAGAGAEAEAAVALRSELAVCESGLGLGASEEPAEASGSGGGDEGPAGWRFSRRKVLKSLHVGCLPGRGCSCGIPSGSVP